MKSPPNEIWVPDSCIHAGIAAQAVAHKHNLVTGAAAASVGTSAAAAVVVYHISNKISNLLSPQASTAVLNKSFFTPAKPCDRQQTQSRRE